ncbi:MAG TPA: response regulator transcription factor [Clostridia bacterium]|nr:response regulator transcription factor [Clostridia bacterium]
MSAKTPTKPPLPERHPILLVDDHPLIRERLAEILTREPDLTVCGETEDRGETLEVIPLLRPTLAIIDLTLKNSDGLELVKDIHARWPEIKILVVSMHDESVYAERVLRAGALGYITKQEASRHILTAVRRVLEGMVYVNDRTASQIITRLTAHATTASTGNLSDLLADRELQVFELTGRGLNTRQIAAQLHIGVKTVETYRARIREKLKVKDPRQLLQIAISWTHHGL